MSAFGLAQDSEADFEFIRGDVNVDGGVDISDSTHLLNGLFLGGARPPCDDAADLNDDGVLDISDGVYGLLYLFSGGLPPQRPHDECGLDPTRDSLRCESFSLCGDFDPDAEPRAGQSQFLTPTTGPGGGRTFFGAGGEEDADGAGAPAAPAPEESDEGGADREIEESDLYRLVGDHLYVLNRFRGLYVLDISDLDNPEVIGHAPIFGYPREMYVRGNTAYILNTDYYQFWLDRATGYTRGRYGSQVRIVDISDPTNPRVTGDIDLDGFCTESRIVGDVLYTVTFIYAWHYNDGSRRVENKTQVTSIQLGDPDEVRVLDQEEFPRNGWSHHIHAQPDAIYLSTSGYDRTNRTYRSEVHQIDISDPRGRIEVRGTARVPGLVFERWALDERDDVLRVASSEGWRDRSIHLSTIDFSDPDRPADLGRYTLDIDESLTAARFDDDRGYLVTYRNFDPLWVFDLQEPRRPRLLGELEMSGWLDFMVPIGDQIVALGHEDLTDPDTGRRSIDLAVSLIDVSLGSSPELLSRVTLDGIRGWVPATRDDFAKVFKVLPREELVLFPFRGWNYETRQYSGGVQLIDLEPRELTRRGLIESSGWVERGIPHEDDTVLALSTDEFVVADIEDRDSPRTRGTLELARNVIDFSFLGDEHTLQLSGNWWQGDTNLVVTDVDDPNSPAPVSKLPVAASYGQMFRHEDLAYVASRQRIDPEEADDRPREVTRVEIVDYSDPASPERRGTVELEAPVWFGYGCWSWGWGDESVLVNGTTLAIHPQGGYFFAEDIAGPVGPRTTRERIYVLDLSDPDDPVHASTIEYEDSSWSWGLQAYGDVIFVSSYSYVELDGQWYQRYDLRRFDVSDPARPVALPPINVPGMLVGVSEDLETIFTFENRWDRGDRTMRSFLYALEVSGSVATVRSRVELLGSGYNSVRIHENAAFASTYHSQQIEVDGATTWRTLTRLHAIDLSDLDNLSVASSLDVPFPWAYLQAVEDGRAFLGSGAGIFVADVRDIDEMRFERFFRTQGWVREVQLRGSRAYLPSGYYGVHVEELGE